MSRDRGALCLVLHSHMPYVEGFGTWPFGEEWLWEAVAGVYLPLIEVLEGESVTIGLTPVLCDQLEAMAGEPGARFLEYLAGTKESVHAEDADGLDRNGQHEAGAELRLALKEYRRAGAAFEQRGRDLLSAFGALAGAGAELLTSTATHAVLPLLATERGLRMQVAGGIPVHERRFGGWDGGFWLPECAYEPGVEDALSAAGVRAFCVDQTAALGLGSLEQLEPVSTPAGAVAVPVDWRTVSLVWDGAGYPSAGAYRDSHRRTVHDLTPWSNAGGPYRRPEAMALGRDHAREFVERAVARLDAYRDRRGRPGLLCCALDTELLGHWWYEGPAWLSAVFDEARSQGLRLETLSAALEGVEHVQRPLAASSWGRGGDLRTWDSPELAELLFAVRGAELALVAAASTGADGQGTDSERALERAARELLAAQSSDWAFAITRGTAGPYAVERLRGHLEATRTALGALRDCRAVSRPSVRNLAPHLDLAPLIEA